MATVLVFDKGGELCKVLLSIVGAAKDLTLVGTNSRTELLQETRRLHPGLVIVNEATFGDELRILIRQLREVVSALPVFVFTDRYGIADEWEALRCGATAIFSWSDEPATILANIREVCSYRAAARRAHFGT